MDIEYSIVFESILFSFLSKHAKIKVAKIISIDKTKRICNVEFFEYIKQGDENFKLPILESVPFFYTQYSAFGNAGVFIPYNINDNVFVYILDNFSFVDFFEKNSNFKAFAPHNLGNAIVMGHAPTLANDIPYNGNNILIINENTKIEVNTDSITLMSNNTNVGIDNAGKVDISNNTTSLKGIIDNTLIAIQNITVTVSGVPTPINNIADFTQIQTLLNSLLK